MMLGFYLSQISLQKAKVLHETFATRKCHKIQGICPIRKTYDFCSGPAGDVTPHYNPKRWACRPSLSQPSSWRLVASRRKLLQEIYGSSVFKCGTAGFSRSNGSFRPLFAL